MSAKVESELARHASKHVEPQFIDDVLGHYAKYLEGFTSEQLANLGAKEHDEFFATRAKASPHMARKKPEPPRRW
jgi:hypothetical protein